MSQENIIAVEKSILPTFSVWSDAFTNQAEGTVAEDLVSFLLDSCLVNANDSELSLESREEAIEEADTIACGTLAGHMDDLVEIAKGFDRDTAEEAVAVTREIWKTI